MISAQRGLGCYTLEHLSHLEEMTKVEHRQEQNAHLAALGRAGLGEDVRCGALTWLFEVASQLNLKAKGTQLAVIYFDIFCSKWSEHCLSVVRPLAMTCLMVAAKFDETSIVTPDTVAALCGNSASAGDIESLEALVLQTLGWELDFPTAAEISSLLLDISAPGHDFSRFMKEADAYASICYSSKSLTLRGPTAIAVAVICCACEHNELVAFRDSWLDLVLPKTCLSRDTVSEVSESIHRHLSQTYLNSNDLGSLSSAKVV